MGQTLTRTGVAAEKESRVRADELRFCVVADWHGAHEPFGELANRLIEERPEFVLVPGDLVNAISPPLNRSGSKGLTYRTISSFIPSMRAVRTSRGCASRRGCSLMSLTCPMGA